ncbi:MAG: 4-aminobutyrate--2-oxoglutarate transaminase [Candidatus Eremiobacteraeota bacterium]|nr:4-aminobutyrate--2-oxoglutarate transaminase [Candidatus Eremiobacteraeota bacterium]
MAVAPDDALTQRRTASIPRGVATAHPLWAERAHGATLWDADGRRFIDFAGGIGVLNAGHTNAKVVAAIRQQSERLTHACFQVTMYEPYLRVAEELNRRAPGPSPKKTLLLSTGAEATENAVKIAREYTRRPAVVAFQHGFHGRTLLALSMTGKEHPYKQHFGPFCGDVHHVPFPYEPHGVTTEDALSAIAALFDSVEPRRVAALIIEPVLGEGGFLPAPAKFLHELRAIADRHGIVLIADEIQSGFGRTGRLFASEHYGIEPDLLTVAKSLGGGLPLAAVVGRSEIMDAPAPGGLGGTFAGNPIACAAALAVLETMDDAFLTRAREVGERVGAALRAFQAEFSAVSDVRGLGAMMAMELSSGTPDLISAARERGLLLLAAGEGNVVRILVPLVVSDEELDEGFAALREAMRSVYGVTAN